MVQHGFKGGALQLHQRIGIGLAPAFLFGADEQHRALKALNDLHKACALQKDFGLRFVGEAGAAVKEKLCCGGEAAVVYC